jgi:hypothetical protein
MDRPGPAFHLLEKVFSNPVVTERVGKRLYYNPAAAVSAIEDALCESGVHFFYNSAPALALTREERLSGIVFGGKTGLFAIEAKALVDATPSATLARAAGVSFHPPESARRLHYTVELRKPVVPRSASYMARGLSVAVEIHHRYASFIVTLPEPQRGPLGEIEDFRKASSAILDFAFQGEEARFRGADAYLIEGDGRASALGGGGVVREFDNLLILGPLGIPASNQGNILLAHPSRALEPFEPALTLLRKAIESHTQSSHETLPCARNLAFPAEKHTTSPSAGSRSIPGIYDPGFDEPGSALREVLWSAPPLAARASLIIAGAGTSGMGAAWRAGNKKMDALCLDRGLEPGGTNTLGGVTNLWYGNDTPAFKRFYEDVGAANNALNAVPFARALERMGVPLYPGLSLTGVAHALGRLAEVYAVGPQGLMAFGGECFIDATGDGSLAAWAGAPYAFGGHQDETTLWGSFAYFKPGHPEAQRPFLSPCDERSALDATRFIVSMRRNSKVGFEQIHTPVPFYLAPRESRHIHGGATVTYLDVLAGRRFTRGVLRATSNLDIKGIATSDAAKAGFIPRYWRKEFAVTVPYDALLSPVLSNCLVAGKAYSITHDALAMARMQRDLYVLGMVAVEATSLAGSHGGCLREVPIGALQGALIALGALKTEDIAEDDFGFEADAAGLAAEVANAPTFEDALVPAARLSVLGAQRALSAIQTIPPSTSESALHLRCFLGDEDAAASVATKLQSLLGESGLPHENYGEGQATPHFMPDQGYAPLPVLLLGNLTASRSSHLASAMEIIAARLDPQTLPYDARWGYLFAFANACEARPDAAWIAPLSRFLALPMFQDLLVGRSEDPRRTRDPMAERHGYLRLALSRALARCGSVAGCRELLPFLGEARLAWARSARKTLTELSGADFGFDKDRWQKWLDYLPAGVRVTPDGSRVG